MYKIKILSIGKTKETWLQEASGEYIKRLNPVAHIEYLFAREEKQLVTFAEKEEQLILLDPQGKLFTSEEFASFLLRELEKGGSRAAFLIGGADGIPEECKRQAVKRSHPLVSFSPLTFTHQMTRLILLEQIYRSFEIAKGSGYHK